MAANTLPGSALSLGDFLRDRRARLAPGAGAPARRRTPGLRREEVAARAGVSVTWYTWLEQGRGGPPSDEVLERLARALQLGVDEREVLFLLAQQRPPPLEPARTPEVPAAMRRMLNALPLSPALVKTACWDVLAWNAAAAAVFMDYGAMPPQERNVLRCLFLDPERKRRLPDWESDARFALAAFRVDAVRTGRPAEADALVAELSAASDDFRRMWADHELRSYGTGVKRLEHAIAGPLALEYTSLTVDGLPGLGLVVYTPLTAADANAIARLLADVREAQSP
jgi:transcriptional regulator with XRE-family HTH domain